MTPPPLAPNADSYRSVELEMIGEHRFKAVNARGGVVPISSGDDPDFTPVELLLAALVACGALDLDLDLDAVTDHRSGFETFAAHAEGHQVRDDQGSHLVQLSVTFDVTFPAGGAGDAARAVVPRLGTVGRTVSLGAPVTYREGPTGRPSPT